MQEQGSAAAGDARAEILIDLDDGVVEVMLAREAVFGLVTRQPDRLVVATVVRILAPGVFGLDRPRRQIGLRLRMAVGAPPQLQRAEGPPRGATIALALVGQDAAAAKCHRYGPAVRGQPTPAGIA